MEVLFNLGIGDDEIRYILEQCSFLMDMTLDEVNEKIEILKYIGCNDRHIKNIIISNPYYLDRINDDVLKLISYLRKIGVNTLNLLFDSNPYLLNKDDFEIREYVDSRLKKGDSLLEIVDEFEGNPYIIDEI